MQVTDYTKAVAKGILAYWQAFPDRHFQNNWVTKSATDLVIENVTLPDNTVRPVCNSSMCAAGTAVFLTTPTAAEFKDIVSAYRHDDEFWVEKGAELLGLDEDEAAKVFYAKRDSAKKLMEFIADGDKPGFMNYLDSDYERL